MKKINIKKCENVGQVVRNLPKDVSDAVVTEVNNLRDAIKNSENNWEKANALLAFIDPQAWAKKHPKLVKPVTVTVLSAVGTACPPVLAIAGVVAATPEEYVAGLMDIGNRPCPPYLIRKLLIEKKLKKSVNDTDMNTKIVDIYYDPSVLNKSA